MPSLAPLAATIRSQASAISSPPATAKPSIAAISGFSAGFWTIPAKPRSRGPRALAGGERLQVHPRAEALALACDHAEAELVVGVELVERGGHRLGHRQVDGVSGVGPVQGDQQDAVAALGEQWLLVHGAGPYNRARQQAAPR